MTLTATSSRTPGTLGWGKLTHARVLQALKNPAYAGAYTSGRSREMRRVQPDGTVRSSRRTAPNAPSPTSTRTTGWSPAA